MLFSKSFIVSGFTFGLMIHSELIFMKGVRSMSRYIFFAFWCPVVPIPFVEKIIFFPMYCRGGYT